MNKVNKHVVTKVSRS